MPGRPAEFTGGRDDGPEGQVQMSFFDNARQSRFVKHQEKQENVSRFAGYFLDRLSLVDSASRDQRTVTLIARSPASPVARSMFASMRECQALDVRFQLAFALLEPAEQMADWMDLSIEEAAGAPMAELRWLRHPSLSDAHEQMVLGLGLSWHGDSMRRDPETRDAFETFECFNVEAARRTNLAFQHIWRICEPVSSSRAMARGKAAEKLPHDVLSVGVSGTTANLPGVTVSTRH
jgi:hypothetical protein